MRRTRLLSAVMLLLCLIWIQPTAAQARTARQEFNNFIAAWNENDYNRMYSMLSPQSQNLYALDEFSQLYLSTQEQLGLTGVEVTVTEETVQGTSAAIRYDATLLSSQFDQIDDSDRIMRFVQSEDGWRVAWFPMDILNGMTGSVRLEYDATYQPRANIYDRDGEYLVQENTTINSLFLTQNDMSNVDACIDLLAEIMVRPRTYFTRLFGQNQPETDFYVGEMSQQTVERHRAALNNTCGTGVSGVAVGSKIKSFRGRDYYGHGVAAHVTGYVGRVPSDQLNYWQQRGYTQSDIVGLSGIEFSYDATLAGQPERNLQLVDPVSGLTLREFGGAEGQPALPVQLTIDRDIQRIMAEAFNDAWNYAARNWVTRSSGGGAVMLDVNTGAVLGMFSYPTFDPRIFDPDNSYINIDTQLRDALQGDPALPVGSALINRAFAEQYAPGSVFKILTLAAATDTGIWEFNDIFQCDHLWYGGSRYGDSLAFREDWRLVFEEPPAGAIFASEALTTSCNPYFWESGALMYQENSDYLHDYAEMFGLGQATGLQGLQNEASGINPYPNTMTTALNNAIGQGDTQTTVLQMARVAAVIANGGIVHEPYIVQQVGGLNGTTIDSVTEPRIVRELDISPEVIDYIQRGMCEVTTNEDLGTGYGVFGNDVAYTSCGKTGSAQSSIAPNSWYVAYAPADNPQVAIAVAVPTSREGSEVAAPIVRRILDGYFNAPEAPFPEWWEEDYNPVPIPQGVIPTDNRNS